MDVATKARRQDGQLLGGLVVTKASNLLRLAANLLLQRADGKGVQGKVVLSRLIDQRLGCSPQGEAAVPWAKDKELVVQPNLAKEKLFLKDVISNYVLVWPDFTFHIDPQYEKLKFESGLG